MQNPLTERLGDYLGQTFEPAPDARILSLVPSLTELLFDLGLADRLVGRTHYCIHPKGRIDDIPSVGGTKKIKMDRVRALAPTHALVNVDENPKEMADALREDGINVIVTHPMHPDDNIDLYRLLGGVFGADEAAADLAERYRTIRAALGDPSAQPARRILYLIWKDPWIAIRADTYIGNMLALVNWQPVTPGGTPAATGDAARYPEVEINDATLQHIDLVLFSSEPYAFGDADIATFQSAFPDHAAKARLIDGEMTSWYGSRAVRGLDYLRRFAQGIPA